MRTVFIDCGANKGQSIEKALKTILKGVEDYKIYSFETLPLLANKLKEYHRGNPKIEVYNKAVWTEDTELKFYVSNSSTSAGSLMSQKLTGQIAKDRYITVQGFNVSKWLKETIKENDYVIFKFDIEGAEYDILYKLIQDGSIKLIDKFAGEFHENKLVLDSNLTKKVLTVKQFFRDVPFEVWEAPDNMGVVDYKKGTRPSLEAAKIVNYDPAGNPVYE